MQDEFYRLDFTGRELQQVPKIHAGFMAASCLAIGEITIFLRLLLMALNSLEAAVEPVSDAVREYAFTQSLVLERSLGSKIHEYIYMVDQYHGEHRKRPNPIIDRFLSENKFELDRIKSHTGYQLAGWYRDKASHHYVISEISKLIGYTNPESRISLYLHEKEGNSGYFLGEQILLHKLLDDPAVGEIKRMREFGDWVQDAAKEIISIHSKYCTMFLEIFFTEKEPDRLVVNIQEKFVGKLTDTTLPLFWDFRKT